MACLIAAHTRCAIKKFRAKTQYLHLKAPRNKVKRQSDKTLTTQINFFLTMQQIEVFLNETG